MRVFRKRRKFGNFQGKPEDAAPLPDIVYQMGAESAARFVAQNPLPQNRYSFNNSSRQEGVYSLPQVYSYVPRSREEEIPAPEMGEKVRSSSPFNFIRSALGIGRSRIDEQYAHNQFDPYSRPGSPQSFGHRSLGTPVKFRQQPFIPEFSQARASSPYHITQQQRVPSPIHYVQRERASSPLHFMQKGQVPPSQYFAPQARPGSPAAVRRLQRAQLSQELQNIDRQQRQQQEMMMMAYQAQFVPQYQQVQQPFYSMMNPNGNMQGWNLMQQQQMYPFY